MLSLPTLADVATAPRILDAFRWEDEITLSCTLCGDPFKKRKGHILRAIQAGQPGSYCGRRCRGQHALHLATETRDGVEGRVCTTCGEWKPKAEMTAKGRARVCMSCTRDQPAQVFSVLRSKAKHRAVLWSLTFDEMMSLWGEPCHYCGEAVATVGLDRVDSSKGYEVGNVVSCCGPCNRGKGDGTTEEFLARCRAIALRVQARRRG